VRADDGKSLSEIFMDLEVTALLVDFLPTSFTDGLNQFLQDERFLRLKDSWKAVRFLQNSWAQLTREQRERLRPVLVASFDRFGDWMGAFVIAEVLGEYLW
jgi:hypothetical protein